jgi:hypothetical protein
LDINVSGAKYRRLSLSKTQAKTAKVLGRFRA